jgi:hypothetical protein
MLRSFVPEKIIRFRNMINGSFNLPHPAMRKVEFDGNVKSTDLSKLTFSLLDVLISTLFDGKKRHINNVNGLQTVRLSGNTSPHVVRLLPLPGHQTVHTIDFSTNEMIHDSPAMNPQYISSYGLSLENENMLRSEIDKRKKSSNSVPSSSFLFQKVCLIDDNVQQDDSLTNALTKLMKR